MKIVHNKPYLFFITTNPEHHTSKVIIQKLSSMNNEVKFEIIDPASQFENFFDVIKEHQHFKNIILLIKPDHSNVYKICDFAIKMGIKAINDPSTTKMFVNRFKTEETIGEILNSLIIEKTIQRIKIPKSRFIKFGPNSDYSHITHYIQDLYKTFPISPPFIIKTPTNHDGLHFVRKISTLEELREYEDRIQEKGLILQQYIPFSLPLLKCYILGDTTVTLEEKIKHVMSNNDIKESRQKVKTPKEFKILAQFIRKNLNLDLFGIDFVKGTDGFYYILDINDFPGFRGIPNAGKLIAEFCLKCITIK